MGYRSDYQLEVESSLLPYDQKKFVSDLHLITEYTWEDPYTLDNTHLEISLYSAKWYDITDDLKKLSAHYPDLRITCLRTGEDGEKLIYDVFNGIIDERHGEMVFPPRTLWT